MTITEIISKYGIERLGRFYGNYRGIVQKTELDGTETLKVYIPSIHDGIMVIARSKGQLGGPNTGFKYLTPSPGSIVYIEFENGDPLKGALWSYHGWANEERPSELDDNSIGLVTPDGNKIIIRESEGKLEIFTKSETHLESTDKVTIKSKSVDILATEQINLIDGKVGVPETTSLLDRLNLIEEKVNSLVSGITKVINNPVATSAPQGLAVFSLYAVEAGKVLTKTTTENIASEKIKQPK